jgi:hypothetical protein
MDDTNSVDAVAAPSFQGSSDSLVGRLNAVVTLIGGAIVIAIVHKILNLAGKDETELSKAPDHPAVVQLHHQVHHGGHVGRVRT